MSNKGKFIDRNPNIIAAGRTVVIDKGIGDTLKQYTTEELAENIVKLKCKEKQEKNAKNVSHTLLSHLPEDSVGELLNAELKKTRFLKFREKFMESMFFQKPQLGRVFPTGSKPEHLTNENTTYGCKTIKSDKLYDLILPRKTPGEVNREYIKWHDKYIVSHNHYFPSEQINRQYIGKFDPKARFGIIQNVDKSGKMVKQALQHCDKLTMVGTVHKKFLDRTQAQLGQHIDRMELNLDPYKTLSQQSKPDKCNMRDLIENRSKCEVNSDIQTAIAYVDKLRRILLNKMDFHMYDLKLLMQNYDTDNTGYITFPEVFQAMRSLLIHANEEKLRLAAIYFGLVIDEGLTTERVNLYKFWQMLNTQEPLPYVNKLQDHLNENDLYDNKDTTYRLLCKDRDKALSEIHNKRRYHKPSDDDRTRLSDLINPSIPLHFGLGPSDFEMQRPKEELRRIFKCILSDEFDNVWEMARAKLNGNENCTISVNDLREAMYAYTTNQLSDT